ncbi:hypothetical protein [Mycolicibacterium diernhoferi]|uniref:Uncharacterized protein n=1 Tax=Mycolicibacterium diernhoferi TaxID=1801 RepID=A0A1Q4HKX2_9MYCO|nr:hypothetical protein [Mycolicibacterium diernhoferi]OJZ68184.1 hypothetical protein BRW64_00890 [Mycolicibacterium diernhoferi]OPE55750.1 hypothetical protein BV510_03390 [Mycolicibacterium diernhoferi]PEG56256.1 hypothetical protein CRI78_02500 [Mycolicibacterium diernhoferi]QYL21328.1 hypothetical protein K0O62_20180 [Mycolicibacterium diernhoferi]
MDIVGPSFGAAVGAIAGRVIQRPSKRVTVNEDRDTFGFGGRPHAVFIPVLSVDSLDPLDNLDSKNHYSKPYRWVDRQGGCDISRTTFQFVVHAHNATVDIIGAEPIVEAVTPPPGIALVPPPAGGPMGIRHISIQLDAATYEHRDLGESVLVREMDTRNEPPTLLASTLKAGETELFHVEAYALRNSYQWVLQLKILVNGKERRETLMRKSNRPFVTMRYEDPAIAARYVFDGGEWVSRT